MQITQELAAKVLGIVDKGLVKGVGVPEPGQMCVEAAVCYALGEPHGDNPSCVGKAVRNFKIRLNDANWSSNEARTKGMRRLAVAQLGSNTINQRKFAWFVTIETVRRIIAQLCREYGLEKEAEACEAATKENCRKVSEAARDALQNAAAATAYAATEAAAAAAYAATAYAAAKGTEKDEYLIISAKIAEDALVVLKSPGVEWLCICDARGV